MASPTGANRTGPAPAYPAARPVVTPSTTSTARASVPVAAPSGPPVPTPAPAWAPAPPPAPSPSVAAPPIPAPPVPAPPTLVVPAPALPTWPPSTNPTEQRYDTARRGTAAYSASGSPAPPEPAYQRGPDPAGTNHGRTDGPGFTTVSFPQGNPLENSGSLTGHILAQGWAEDPPTTRSNTTKVVIVLAASLGLLIAISLLVVFLANDAMSGLTGNTLSS